MIAGLPKVPANAFIQLSTKAFSVFKSSLETFATPPLVAQFLRHAQILILETPNVFLPAPQVRQIVLGWLKFSPFLNLSKNEHFSQVSIVK